MQEVKRQAIFVIIKNLMYAMGCGPNKKTFIQIKCDYA